VLPQLDEKIIVANQKVQSPAVKTSHFSSTETTQDNPSNEVLEAVRGFLAAFSKAAKSFSLYPATHVISENLLSGLVNSLTNFFQLCPELKLTIDKDRISYKEIDVYQSNGREDFVVAPLFRDGIILIEFRKGITAPELSFLLDKLHEYRTISDESEGDLVTALWQKNLPHIHYEAADVFWETQPRLDFSHFDGSDSSKELQPGPSGLSHSNADGEQQSGSEDTKNPSTLSIISKDVKRSLIPLTPSEKKQLQNLIKEEEYRNRSEDILDLLLIILEDEAEEEELNSILELLVQEFEYILRHGEFQLAVKILNHLRKLSDKDPSDKTRRDLLIDQYFERVSDAEFLEVLKSYLAEFESDDATRLKVFRQVLLMLRPKAVLALGPLLSEVSSAALRRRLMEAIGVLSKQDLKPLRQLLKVPDEQMVKRLVTIVGHLDGKDPQRLLLDMAYHPSLDVRKEALKQLLNRNGCVQRSFFFLLEDSSDVIRREILHRLASERNPRSEDPLLEYLGQKVFKVSTNDHILACYEALGKCGSTRSIPLLKATLQERSWWEIFNLAGSPHRRGAALALAALNNPEADKILMQASRSLFPPIKRAARRAISGRRPE
jgi:Arc/MetJ-type ribon-helix-helix transcriptional regulator